jgi:hypothetical protein
MTSPLTFTTSNLYGRNKITLTVAGLRELLRNLPGDMPILATWETTLNRLDPEDIEIREETFVNGVTATCLVLGVEAGTY